MIMIMLCVVLLVIGQIMIAIKSDFDAVELVLFSILYWLCGLFVAFLICMAMIPMTGGLMRGYSEGVREGYITKISEKGVIWKTYEAQIQVGTGEMVALQAPFEFSIPKDNKELYQTILKNLGKKVNIEYIGWLSMPYWVGNSNVELTKIKEK